MKWVGKIGGGVLGLLAGGPVGALVGVVLGHQFDRGLAGVGPAEVRTGKRRRSSTGRGGASQAARQQVFFETTFLAMGHLAKADGRVSEEEIQAARTVMHQMRLSPEHVRLAITLFTRGKQSDFPIDNQLQKFKQACGRQPELVRMFLEIQMELALSPGTIQPSERDLLWRMAGQLGVGRVELVQLEALVRARRGFGQQQRRAPNRQADLARAYQALGVEPSASDQDVKYAYRKLMNQHHPDKLVAKGLPDSMLENAKEKTREIRSAYELIRERRNMK